ncbi:MULTISPECIES: ferritin [Brevibacterium]|uniref:Ferritin n=2 Tax=Brevibacterium TaxID=1696 RepID=A0A1H1Y5C1_BRESA|nr:ferritin [Brevibacterium sandarakinum]MDN5657027.1 ferritin [Brevibacterium sandarakinum]SDT16582.1 ferritin [Brevibacterium sandarakinum]
MQLSPAMQKVLGEQVTLELEASMVYLQLSIQLDALDLPGMTRWMRAQSEEEQVHAAKFIQHCQDRDFAPQIGDIAAPKVSGSQPIDFFKAALAHEEKVSESIRNLYRTAQSEGDLDVLPLLHWFIDEQVEEESTISEIIGRLDHVADSGSGLLRIDSELGSRHPDIKADSE